MLEKLTLRAALEKCRDQWTWLRDNSASDKADYFETVDVLYPFCGCYCCEYAVRETGKKPCDCCDACPLLSHWPETCEGDEASFELWQEAHHDLETTAPEAPEYKHLLDASRFQANEIVQACERKLARLDAAEQSADAAEQHWLGPLMAGKSCPTNLESKCENPS